MTEETEIQPPPARHSQGVESTKRVGGWIIAVVAVIALAALGLAAWAAFRPAPKAATASEPTYSDTQRAEAKTKACTAFSTVRTGVNLNTNLTPPGGPDDVTGALSVAANGRLALNDGGQYLLARLDPATPSDLATALRKFADDIMDIGAGATAGLQNADPGQAALLADAGATDATIAELCK